MKIKCLDHLQEVLSESKRQNMLHREDCLRLQRERDEALSALYQLKAKQESQSDDSDVLELPDEN